MLYAISLFCIGTIFGSFLNVVIYRLPNQKSIVKPRSQCGACSQTLSPIDLVPIFSFLINKGKCRYCEAKLSLQYPLVEVVSGLALVFCFYVSQDMLWAGLQFALFEVLLAQSLIDYKHRILPDSLNLAIGILALVAMLMGYKSLVACLLGLIIGGGTIFAIILAGDLVGVASMFGGDMKLMAACGLFLGWPLTLVALVLTFLSAGLTVILLLVFKKVKIDGYVSFGPFIAFGAMVASLYGNQLLTWYLALS